MSSKNVRANISTVLLVVLLGGTVSATDSLFGNASLNNVFISSLDKKNSSETENEIIERLQNENILSFENIRIEIFYRRSELKNLELYALFYSNDTIYDVYYSEDLKTQYPEIELAADILKNDDKLIISKFCERIIIRLRSNPRRLKRITNIEDFLLNTEFGRSMNHAEILKNEQSVKKSEHVFSYLEELKVVTATKSETSLRETPSAVYVITESMIKERGYRTVIDALADIPGFQFQRTYGTNPDLVNQRGLIGQNQRSLLYIDGQPDNNISDLGIRNGSLYYPLHNVKQIEIVAGPASALYGANAFNGIINVLSKDQENETDSGHANLTFGSWNNDFSYNAYAVDFAVNKAIRTDKDNLSFSAAGYYLKSDGPDFRGIQNLNSDRKGYWWSDYYNNSREEGYSANLRMRWNNFRAQAIAWQHIQGGGTFANGIREIDTNTRGFEGYNWDFRNNSIMTGYTHDFTRILNLDSEVRIRHTEILSSSKDEYVNTDIPSVYNNAAAARANNDITLYKDYARPDYGYEIIERLSYNPNAHWSTQLGFEAAHYSTPAGYGAHIRYLYQNYGTYIQQLYKPVPELAVTAGFRFDHNTIYGNAATPRLSLVWSASSNLTLKSFYSTGFRAPTAWELFNATAQRLANPELAPERLNAYEIGAGYRFLKNYYLNAQVYYNQISNLILEASTNEANPNGGFWNKNQNVGSARVVSTEIKIDANPFLWLSFFTAYTFTSSEYFDLSAALTSNPGVKDSTNIPNLASHVFHVGSTWTLMPGLSAHLRANLISARENIAGNPERETPGYTMLHANLRWSKPLGSSLVFNLSIRNLLNVQAWDPGIRTADGNYYPTRHPLEGRNFWLTVGSTF
ncbi:MAG: TonB-dependent receptor [Leptospiraceae bacterium]|nr:TonB-dependent receptor [Leptospiraceae bacterium]